MACLAGSVLLDRQDLREFRVTGALQAHLVTMEPPVQRVGLVPKVLMD